MIEENKLTLCKGVLAHDFSKRLSADLRNDMSKAAEIMEQVEAKINEKAVGLRAM